MIEVIEGEYCRIHLEGKLWQLRSIRGFWLGKNCPADDLEQANKLVAEYDKRVRTRIQQDEQSSGKKYSLRELVLFGRNPNWPAIEKAQAAFSS